VEAVRQFCEERAQRIAGYVNSPLAKSAAKFMQDSVIAKYSYNFTWLGRPIIQYPPDVIALQEVIWEVRPDLIIETGIAHGGSLIHSASMLALIDYADAVAAGVALDPQTSPRRVLGVDIDIRAHNRTEIAKHPFAHKILMIEGPSTDLDVVARVREIAGGFSRILVCLDSNHTHDHVLAELQAYAPLTTRGSYCIVFDTNIEDLPDGLYPDRPWGKGNNPKTAVRQYLRQLDQEAGNNKDGETPRFQIDRQMQNKLLLTVAPEGYLRRL
jgi:cephalosporin hydroxylase